jgi:hypothetical protein
MKDLIINLRNKEHALKVNDFAVRYFKDNLTPSTADEKQICTWLKEMKAKGGWFKINITRERMKLIYDSSALN